jgi:hypothetical protein
MVRKKTLIMLVVFVSLLGLVFYLQENPLPGAASTTPSPTMPVQMLPGLRSDEISGIQLQENQGMQVAVIQDAAGSWQIDLEGQPLANPGKVEQLCAQIAAVRVMTFLPEDTAPDALGLSDPAYILNVRTNEQQNVIQVGKRIPTGYGYYAQVNDQTPIVIDQNNIDTIVSLMNDLLQPEAAEEQQTPAP